MWARSVNGEARVGRSFRAVTASGMRDAGNGNNTSLRCPGKKLTSEITADLLCTTKVLA